MNPTEFHISCFAYFILLMMLIEQSVGVPPDYCLQDINIKRCSDVTKPVFYYYKPGSRCERIMWRGCPTANIFPDQFLCIHTCIARVYFKNITENLIELPSKVEAANNTEPGLDEHSCAGPMNSSSCATETEEVFTYDLETKTCVKGEWKGCPTINKFADLVSCEMLCKPKKLKTIDDWNTQIVETLPSVEVNEINEILDKFIYNDKYLEEPEKMKYVTNDKKTTSKGTPQEVITT